MVDSASFQQPNKSGEVEMEIKGRITQFMRNDNGGLSAVITSMAFLKIPL